MEEENNFFVGNFSTLINSFNKRNKIFNFIISNTNFISKFFKSNF